MTSTERTTKVSSSTPNATAKPISVTNTSGSVPRAANVPARTTPAEVMTPPVAARPISAPRRGPWRLVSSCTLVFNNVFGFAGADPSFPLWTFVFLVALGTDYNIFLMTRVREESMRHGTRRGALIGLAATGGVITSAGVVLAGTFAALGTLPLVFVTEIGFAVAFGVLLDTFVVRSVLVTALNLDVGRRIWWPSRLADTEDVALDELVQEETTALAR